MENTVRKWPKSLFKALPLMLVSAGFVALSILDILNSPDFRHGLFIAAVIATWVLVNAIFLLMVHTGKTDKYRAALFIIYAVFFIIGFIGGNLAERGSMVFTQQDVADCEIPFCHIATTMMILPLLTSGTLVFPGVVSSILTMVISSVMAALILGRGFCGYLCFYGGLEDGCSRIRKKPRIKNINPKWALLPYAVLIAAALTSIAALSPTYCFWVCPFKAVTEFEQITSAVVVIQTVIFVVLFVGLVIVGPILTKKRTQCSFLCPFGALMSLSNPINPFTIRIDTDKCSRCGRCIDVCQTFSLSEVSLSTGKPRINCTKCGKCVDACPRGAIHFHIKGTRPDRGHEAKRLIFLYLAYLFLTVFGAPLLASGIYRVLLLITTGSIA